MACVFMIDNHCRKELTAQSPDFT